MTLRQSGSGPIKNFDFRTSLDSKGSRVGEIELYINEKSFKGLENAKML